MLEAFVLNPPRRKRKASRSRRRGRRTNARGWFGRRSKGSFKRRIGKRRNRRTVYTRPSAKTRRKSRRARRRRNPGAAKYGINPTRPRRRRKSSSRRRRNTGAARYGINPGVGGGLLGKLPSVIEIPALRRFGMVGGVLNNVVQGALAGGLVFGGYYASGQIANMILPKLPAAMQGKFTKPVVYGVIAGLLGGATAMLIKGKRRALWSVLAASGAGIRAFGSLVQALIPADSTGMVATIRTAAGGLADYIQVGEEVTEAGLGYEEDVEEAGLEDYIQVGEEVAEAGLGEEISVT